MGRTFQEISSDLWAQLDHAMNNDYLLPLPRKSKQGEPTSWVAADYQDSWLIREKLLVIPKLTGGGLYIGIVECNPNQTKIQSGGKVISCHYIVDTQEQYEGPIIIAGKSNCHQAILRSSNTNSSVEDELLQHLRNHLPVESLPEYPEDQLDAFAGFLSLVLSQQTAYGIPLEATAEMLEESEARCLGYLYANLIARS